MFTIFLFKLIFSFYAFSASGAELLRVVLDGFKDGVEGFLVGGVNVFFAFFLDGDEVALEQGF